MTTPVKVRNEDIPHVGPDTPAGQWFRRYWMAVSRVEDLRDIPVGIRILGEDLVLFRDLRGRPGLIGASCPHRGTSLEYGDIEEQGIRCAYHGWLFNVEGRCLEQPAEPEGSIFHTKIRHTWHPVREMGGLIFAYLGPDGDNPPPLPRYAPLAERGGLRQIEPTRYFDYNWLNFYENSADPIHVVILHRESGYGQQSWGDQFFSMADPPAYEPVETYYGMKIVMTKPGHSAGTEVVDEMSLGLPSILQIGDTEFVHAQLDKETLENKGSHFEHAMFITPNDDHHFMMFTVDHYSGPDPDIFEHLKEMRKREVPKQEVKEYDHREHMPFRGNVRREDVMTQGTQGILSQRPEHLGTSDVGVIMIRRLLRQNIQAAVNGERPKGVLTWDQAEDLFQLDSFVGVRSKSAT